MAPLGILLLEDDQTDAELVQAILEADRLVCNITRVQTCDAFVAALEGGDIDLILADYKLPSFDGLTALELAQARRSDLPFIFVSGTLGEETAIEAFKRGATDYVLKTGMTRLVPSVRRALREARERQTLRQLEQEIARLNRVSMMGQMAASLAHELKQPVAAIALNANACLRWLQREPPETDEARKLISEIGSVAGRAAHMVDRNRALFGQGAPQRELMELNESVREVINLLRNVASHHSIQLKCEFDPALPAVKADRVQLQQVLMNLMLNGIESMQDRGGPLSVTSKRMEDGDLLVSVSDAGVGLPEDQQERVFEAFFTTKPHGIGMGLSISRRIIESHGGRLWATANPTRGATFHFTVPAR